MSRTPTHPGAHLAERLAELNMSAAELGRRLAVPTNRITGILNGQRGITGDTALRLGHFFGTPAEHWLNLQMQYNLKQAREKVAGGIRSLPRLHAEPSGRYGSHSAHAAQGQSDRVPARFNKPRRAHEA
jgi:addiction module HigA family antidote